MAVVFGKEQAGGALRAGQLGELQAFRRLFDAAGEPAIDDIAEPVLAPLGAQFDGAATIVAGRRGDAGTVGLGVDQITRLFRSPEPR
jgi:hypothetical protein